MTFDEIRNNIRANLDDAGVTFYSADDLVDSMQDGYDDIAFQAKNIIKKATLPFLTSPYYDFSLLVSDFLAVVAIFNKNNNRWLDDNLTLRDFDKLRNNWELWNSSPAWWAHVTLNLVCIVPTYPVLPAQGFDLYYSARAPAITDFTESPLISQDFQKLLEWYSTKIGRASCRERL